MNAIAWYKSPVFVSVLVSLGSKLIVIFPALSKALGITSADMPELASLLTLAIGGVADLVAAHQRATSSLQPLTATAAGAAASNAPPASASSVSSTIKSVAAAVLMFGAMVGAVAVLSGMSGCATVQTFNEKYAAAVQTDTAVLSSTQSLLQANVITAADAQNIEAQADNAKSALDLARDVYATDQKTGGDKLAAAVTALNGLSTYLQQRQSAAGAK